MKESLNIQTNSDPCICGQASSAGMVIGWTAGSSTVLGPTQPPIEWVPEGISPGVKQPGREAGRSQQWSYTSTPHDIALN
jgi:hypothetical protein